MVQPHFLQGKLHSVRLSRVKPRVVLVHKRLHVCFPLRQHLFFNFWHLGRLLLSVRLKVGEALVLGRRRLQAGLPLVALLDDYVVAFFLQDGWQNLRVVSYLNHLVSFTLRLNNLRNLLGLFHTLFA